MAKDAAATPQQVDSAQAEVEMAKAQLEMTRRQTDAARAQAGGARSQTKVQQAQVALAEAVNVDLDASGWPRMRRGQLTRVEDPAHSLFPLPEHLLA